MWVLPLVGGAIVPHAPVLVTDVSGDFAWTDLSEVRGAAGTLRLPAADVAVVVSPHGRRAGIYRDVIGSLERFGTAAGFSTSLGPDPDSTRALAQLWGVDELDGPMDHGLTVPSNTFGPLLDVDAVACTLPEVTGPSPANPDEVRTAAARLAAAIERFAQDRDVVLVASAHLGAALTPRAPDGYRPETVALDDAFLDAFQRDAGESEGAAERLASEAASCGLGPLLVLARCFAGLPGNVHAYFSGFGVGYVVASVVAPDAPPPRPSTARAVTTPELG